MDSLSVRLKWENLNLSVTKRSFQFKKFKLSTEELHILNDGKFIKMEYNFYIRLCAFFFFS